jgi:two-component system, cell cycle sensor histidine kinase and response regulator CckA
MMSVVICATPTGAATSPQPEALLGAWTGSAAFVYCRNLSGQFMAANEAFARKFGRPTDQIMGKPTAGLVHQDDVKSFSRSDETLQRPPYTTAHEQRWLTPQGWRWIDWEESAIFNVEGQIIGVRAVGHDITRRRLAEEQFHKLSSAVEQSPIAIAITDAEGAVQYVNGKFTATTGLTLETILDRELDVLRELHTSEVAYQEFRERVRSGQEWRGELRRQSPTGSVIWESVQVGCLRNANGEIANLLLLREDISERKALEEQLRQMGKMESIGTLAGGIAHDFNNILAVINGYAELCVLNATEPAIIQKSVREIKRAAERATGLVRQILTFSRKTEVRVAPLDLNQHLRDLVKLLAETFPRNITFQFNLDDALPPLLADQNQLQQIVLNLCVNARDAMANGGTITLTTSRLDGDAVPASMPRRNPCACLKVSDTGTGMPAQVRERIFEPFFTTKGVNKGTGLGLAVVYGIVASHEGCIDVESTVGQGSTFRVCLPFSDAAIQSTAISKPSEFPGGTESILIVDDEAALRLLLETTLSRKGYTVSTAQDGLEAIDILGRMEKQFDVVLLDLNMPGATGIEVLKVLRVTHPQSKVLVLTGHLSPEAKLEFEHLGHREFIRKPYTLDELGRKIRAILV